MVRDTLSSYALAAALVCAGCFSDQPPPDISANTSEGATSTGGTSDASATTGPAPSTDASSTGISALCGNDVLEEGEQCDDGGLVAGDGCSPTCAFEGLYVFRSQGKINGNAGALADVDKKCQAEAEAHKLPGTYYAWLSIDNVNAPSNRFAAHERPYILPGPDAPVVAVGLAGLTKGVHERGIDRGPDGIDLPNLTGCTVESLVWTGTEIDGNVHADTCMGFTNADIGVKGRAGRYSAPGTEWSDKCSFDCNNSLPFYCFQQP